MKKGKHLIMTLVAALAATFTAYGSEVAGYTCDFNGAINTSRHDFKVASNWKHIVGSYYDGYSDYYMTYTHYKDQGRSGQPGDNMLACSQQMAGDNWDKEVVYDLLITPVVSGEISIWVKASNTSGYSSSNAWIEFYSLNEAGTAKADLLSKTEWKNDGSGLSTSEWQKVTLPVDDPQRIGIRGQYVYLDDFTAETADITPEASMEVATAVPSETTGLLYWDQQPDGSVEVKYSVTVTNTGDVTLAPGTSKYSVSIINGRTNEVYGTTNVPHTITPGQTSEPFDVIATIADPATAWPNSYTNVNMNLRENLGGGITARAGSRYNAYEPKFVFRTAGSTSGSSLSGEQAYGIISEDTSKEFEIYNDGVAPLTIKSINIPAGFTAADIPAAGTVIQKKSSLPLTITLPATTAGSFSGNLEIVHIDKTGAEITYTLAMSGNVIGADTWVADFDNTTTSVVYPPGSVSESGIQTDYNRINNIYNYYLKSYTSSSYATQDNKFITPKLHAEAGDAISFDLAYDRNGADYALKVYKSTDRLDWGEPIATFPATELSMSFVNKSVTIDETGDFYIGFAVYGVKIDNIVGLKKNETAHDIYFKQFTISEEAQTGDLLTPEIEIIPLYGEAASAYTVNFHVNDAIIATVPSVELTASARDTKRFRTEWTPEVEATTDFLTYFTFDFNDGTTFKSAEKTVKVTCEPEFFFLDKDQTVGKYRPQNLKAPIDFGMGNELGLSQEYKIYNWGKAPLTVKSVTVPAGFSVNISEPVTVPSKESIPVIVTFSAETAGIYTGSLQAVYSDGAGTDQTFQLEVKGTLLDPSKWYASFDGDGSMGTWPAGSLYNNVSMSNGGTYAQPDYYLTGQSASSMLISPKLSASQGEAFTFSARTYSSSWSEGTVTFYTAPTRDGLTDEAVRHELASFSGQSDNEATKLTDTWHDFSVTAAEAGDFYLGIAINGRAQVDNIYGFSVAPVAHEWVLSSISIPPTAMQNKSATAKIILRNIGLQPEEAGTYSIVAHVGDKTTTVEGTVDMPTTNSLTASTGQVEIPVEFKSPKPGTFPVYFELKADDYTLATDPAEVTFSPETASSLLEVGTPAHESNGDYKGEGSNTIFNHYDKNSTSVVLYTPEDLQLNGGEKITSLTFRGVISKDLPINYKLYYEFTDDTEQAKPDAGEYNVEGMTQILDLKEENYSMATGGSYAEPVDLFTVEFSEPVVYPAGKSLRLVSRGGPNNGYGRTYVIVTGKKANSWGHSNDNSSTFASQTWNAAYLPVMYLGLSIEPTTLSGKVNRHQAGIEGAVVHLVSTDGDDIQYEAATDADGNYEINVIQNSRTYTVSATKDNLYADAVEMSFDASKVKNFDLKLAQAFSEATSEVTAGLSDVTLDLQLTAGLNTMVLPFTLSAEEIKTVFGTDAAVHSLGSDSNGSRAIAHFLKNDGDMQGGVPYLLYLPAARHIEYAAQNVDVVAQPAKTQTANLDFNGVYAQTPATDAMYILDGRAFYLDEQLKEANPAVDVTKIVPFRAYLTLKEGAAASAISFDTNTGIRDIVKLVTLSGKVVRNNEPAADAVIVLAATGNSAIKYQGVSDARGNYMVDVIETALTYDVTATKGDLFDHAEGLVFDDSQVVDFDLMLPQTLTEATETIVAGRTDLTFGLDLPAGLNTLVLPFQLKADDVPAVFGADAVVHRLDSDSGEPRAVAHFFKHDEALEAGIPYLLYMPAAVNARYEAEGIVLIDQPSKAQTENLEFVGVFTPTPVTDGMYILDGSDFLLGEQPQKADSARQEANVLPFHAYLAVKEGSDVTGITYDTDTGIVNGIENVVVDTEGNGIIYNLQGVRVTNPGPGIYIVNGQKVVIR